MRIIGFAILLTIIIFLIFLPSSCSKLSNPNQLDLSLKHQFVSINSDKHSNHLYFSQAKTSMYNFLKSITIQSPLTCIKSNDKDKVQESLITRAQSFFDSEEEFFGVPKLLIPYYLSFIFDSIAVGLVMPLLPFIALNMGANAFQLSLVISSNYFVQSIGCIVMGKVSDHYGRKLVMTICLTASVLSYFALSQANSLVGIALAKIIAGSFGGLVPIMQSAVADVAPLSERPKYMGRITASFGLGFVLGPTISALLYQFSIDQKIFLSAFLPLIGLAIMVVFSKDTKGFISSSILSNKINTQKPAHNSKETQPNRVTSNVIWLMVNGFSLMYAFGTESIYAILLKDGFGYSENTLSTLLAGNGILIGLCQVFLIKPLVSIIGKHATLLLGNMGLAFGMLGVALVRTIPSHFILFCLHMVSYSIADTSLVSLISRYSSASTQGQNLALNQASQSLARVASPLIAGYLYDLNKSHPYLPVGAYPFLLGAFFPAISTLIPIILYYQNHLNRAKKEEDYISSIHSTPLNTLLNNVLTSDSSKV